MRRWAQHPAQMRWQLKLYLISLADFIHVHQCATLPCLLPVRVQAAHLLEISGRSCRLSSSSCTFTIQASPDNTAASPVVGRALDLTIAPVNSSLTECTSGSSKQCYLALSASIAHVVCTAAFIKHTCWPVGGGECMAWSSHAWRWYTNNASVCPFLDLQQ